MRFYYANAHLKQAKIAILGLPFDRTSSFIPGSRFGPQFIRQSSDNIEDYSLYHKKSLLSMAICDLGDHAFDYSKPLEEIENNVLRIYRLRKKGIFLGGEHTITLGIVRALRKIYKNLCVIQFDAHADLRDDFQGEKICHATVMKRVTEIIGRDNLFQLGIRSGLRKEIAGARSLFRFSVLEHLSRVRKTIGARPVFLSIDVDVLDPGILPAVATPEPGGITYQELVTSLVELKSLHLIGADVVEFNPLAAAPFPSGSVVAGLLKELILCFKR